MPRPIRQEITAVDKTQAAFRSVSRSVGGLKATFAGLGVGLSVAGVASGLIEVAKTTDKLKASLQTVTGSAEKAEIAFAKIKEFTSTTPFQIAEVSDAFIKLAAYGIEPTNRLMRSLGNTASALGKPLEQAVEALADAAVGEFERLKEFGIKARSEGDKVAFTFRGATKVVEKEAAAITAYLQSIGETDFAGAMERQMDTLGGVFSNLGDAVFDLADTFANESGFTEAVKDATREVTELINAMKTGDTIVQQFGKGIGIAIADLMVGDASVEGARKQRIEELEESIGKIQDRLRTGLYPAGQKEALEERLQRSLNLLEVLKSSLNDPEFQKLNNEQLTIRISGGQVAGELGNIAPTANASAKSMRELAKAAKEAEKAKLKFEKSLQSLTDKLDPVGAKTREYMESVALLDKAWTEGYISGERYDQLMMKLATDTDAVKKQQDELRKKAEEQKQQWSELGPIIGSAFEDAIVAGEDFSDVLKGLEQDIIRLITRMLITRPIEDALTTFIGGFDFGSIFGGARASGGPVKRDVPYLVGEEGPELYVPNSSGTIIPNDALRSSDIGSALGGGVTVNVVNNANGTQATTSERTEGGNKIIDIMIDQVKNSIAGDISRGAGPIPGAMQSSYGLNRVAGAY